MSNLNPITSRGHRHGHTRSLSNPFSGIGIGKRRKSPSRHDFLDSDDDDDDVTFPLPEVSAGASASAAATSPKKPPPVPAKDMVTGRCMTCNTAVKWPKHLNVFRCTSCLMVNDLDAGAGAQRGIPRKAIPVSIEQTRAILERCLVSYLRRVIDDPARCLPVPRQGHSREFSDPNPEAREQARPWIFRPLEEYIIQSFKGVDCLNNSFTTPTTTSSADEGTQKMRSEPTREPISIPMRPSRTNQEYGPDAKSLLLGDLAENTSWPLNDVGQSSGRNRRQQSPDKSSHSKNVSHKTPRIDWPQLAQWYQLFLVAGADWVEIWSAMRPTELVDRVDAVRINNWNSVDLSMVDREITEARFHLHRTLLKATENLLKRPRKPLKRPEDMRFLLILLANPLIYPSSTVSKAQDAATSAREQRRPIPSKEINRMSPHDVKSLRKEPPRHMKQRTPPRGPGQHSGIVKRILGILSNMPDDCHHALVSWFSRYSIGHFERIVDLFGSFVTYRLTRQHGRKRSESAAKDDNSLIPTFSSAAGNTPAEMHAALNGRRQAGKKAEDQGKKPTVYGDDWQIQAAARIMSLLFRANTANKPRNHDGAFGRLGGRRGHMIPISSFYNMLLDYSDLVADYETWESRAAKFSFCQYSFFLSIWAKIHIMEYDARRQMEVKAREAFFNSILNHKAVSQYLVLKVRRDCLVEDSLRNVSEVVGTGHEEIKKGLRIEFLGEEGIDAGGLRKEWFLLLVREVFDPNHGLFLYDDESQYCYFNPHCFESSEQFFLVGVLLGLAIYNSTILDVALPPFAFKKLMSSAPPNNAPQTSVSRPTFKCSVDDLAEYRPTLARGLQQLLEFEGDVQETFCYDFVAPIERYGEVVYVPLCPGGERRPVTNANRREFVDLYVRYLLDTAVTRQFEPFKRGFFTVCAGNALTLFRPEEIELLVRGSDEALDVASLRAVATYDNWSVPNPEAVPVVRWFWSFFEEAAPEAQRKILSFITGGDRIPAMGATSLMIRLACLGDDTSRYPTARTCFNTLGLYRYPTREKLENKLWEAVVNSEGFGLK